MTQQAVQAWLSKAQSLADTKSQIKKLTLKQKEIEKELLAVQDGKSFSHGRYAFQLSVVRGSVDYKSIPMLHGLDLDQYRKEDSERWLFKVLY